MDHLIHRTIDQYYAMSAKTLIFDWAIERHFFAGNIDDLHTGLSVKMDHWVLWMNDVSAEGKAFRVQ